MNKFDPVKVKIGETEYALKCTAAALAKIEDIYNAPFTEAVTELAQSIETRSFRISRLASVFCALCVDKADEQTVLKSITDTKGTIAMAEGIGYAIAAHFPSMTQGEAGGEAEADPKKAAAPPKK